MDPEQANHDLLSLGIVGTVAVVCVVIIVLNLGGLPATAFPEKSGVSLTGRVVDYRTSAVGVGTQFDVALMDLNQDGRLDFYDYLDVLSGKADCQTVQCDLDRDGSVNAQDQILFNNFVRRLYDYNNDAVLDRTDAQFLKEILLGNERCSENHVCDVDGDGAVSSKDLTAYTSLLYNFDAPVLS